MRSTSLTSWIAIGLLTGCVPPVSLPPEWTQPQSTEGAGVRRSASSDGSVGLTPRFDRSFIERAREEVAERRRQDPSFSLQRALVGQTVEVAGTVFMVALPDSRILNPTRYSVVVIPNLDGPVAATRLSRTYNVHESCSCGFALTDESAKGLQAGQPVVIRGRIIAVHAASGGRHQPGGIGVALDDCVLVSVR